MPKQICNPILKGFNPDPSIVRVNDDYYIATSTFEWYPGVQIHHSRDLANWSLLTRPLNRASQLNMLGEPDSCGVWAPCLSYDGGKFYLVFTDVKRYGKTSQPGGVGAGWRDMHNYLVTATDICGPWSDPFHLNSSGFDPSLFHDDGGRKYIVNMIWDHRPGKNRFGGIILQEFCPRNHELIGDRKLIFSGTEIGFTEAPHLYKRNGYYYLLTAEGGTGWGHTVTMARSRQLDGPYELHPDKYVLTSRYRSDVDLQRAGHADLVETQSGETYMVYLCGRPLPNRGRCTLGRETAIQRMSWQNDWLYTENRDQLPTNETPRPTLPEHNSKEPDTKTDFDVLSLPLEFQWLRSPWPQRLWSLTDRPGHLRLFGRETVGSFFEQALVARRQQDHRYTATTCVDFEPKNFQQQAGLICYYNSSKLHYLFLTHNESLGRILSVVTCHPDLPDTSIQPIKIPDQGRIHLRVQVDGACLRFYYRTDDSNLWNCLPQIFDASILSDEAGPITAANFTGAFVGMACQDFTGKAFPADFDYFHYVESN